LPRQRLRLRLRPPLQVPDNVTTTAKHTSIRPASALVGAAQPAAARELRQVGPAVAMFRDLSTFSRYRSAHVKAIESAPCFLELPALLRLPSTVRGPVLLAHGLCKAIASRAASERLNAAVSWAGDISSFRLGGVLSMALSGRRPRRVHGQHQRRVKVH